MRRADDVSIEIAINESQTLTGIESVGTNSDSNSNQKGILRSASRFTSSSQRPIIDYGNESVEINYSSRVTNDDSSLQSEPAASHGTQRSKEDASEDVEQKRITKFMSCLCRSDQDSGEKNKYWAYFREIMSGFIVSITSVPELIAAALLAGLPAHYGLTTAWIICLVTSAVGGIRGLISGVTPSLAIILVSLVQTSGVGYAIYAALFASLFQMAVGVLKIGEFIRFIPYPVMVGFLTGTALLIVLSQLTFFQEPTVLVQGQSRPFYNLSYQMNAFTAFTGGSWVTPSSAIVMIIEALMTLIISIALPRFTKVIPSILVALIVVTGIGEWAIARSLGFSGTLVGELATINTPSWPMIFFFDKSIEIPPLNMDTFLKIWPTGIAIFFISQVQNILALKHIRSVNRDNESDVNLVSLSQGVGQFISSMCGGMAGSVMISQSVILHECGGVNNLSVFSAGILIFGVCAGAYTALSIVPIGFIIGINVFAAFKMVHWADFITILSTFFSQQIRDRLYLDSKVNRIDTVIMVVVFTLTIFFDAALAAIVGVLIAVFEYAWDCSTRISIEREKGDNDNVISYRVKGYIFFATANKLVFGISEESIAEDPQEVIILMESCEIVDWTGMLALKNLHDRLQSSGKDVAISSLTPRTKSLMEKSSAMWSGVVFLEVQEVFDGESTTICSKKGF